MTTTIPTAIELADALRDGRATIERPETVAYDEGQGVVNSGAAWPDWTIDISLGGWTLTVPVWAVVSWDRHGDWSQDESDGCYRGYRAPELVGDAEDGYEVIITGGDNLRGEIARLDAGRDEAPAEAALDVIADALRAAYLSTTVAEPDIDILDESDVPRRWHRDGHNPNWVSEPLGVYAAPAIHEIVTDETDVAHVDYATYDEGGGGIVWLVLGLPRDIRRPTRDAAEAAARTAIRDMIMDRGASCGLDLGDLQVTVEHSVAAGNCRAESERAAAVIRERTGRDEITAADVLAAMPDSDAARRACVAAALED